MADFYCSIITPPARFVSRVRVTAMDSFHAFRFMQDKYSRVLNFCPDALILVRPINDYYHPIYYDWKGVDITHY